MKLKLSFLFSFIWFTATFLAAQTQFYNSVDISFLKQLEDAGVQFNENGVPKDAVLIFKDHGINLVRLRIWHTPADDYSNLENTLILAKRMTDAGLSIYLDFHYSDWWSDPGNQQKPKAWENLSFEVLKDSVYQYSKKVLTALKEQNTTPKIVQIGNEIAGGMLWNDGKIYGMPNESLQWDKFSDLLKSGINGVKDAVAEKDSVQIMIHIEKGGDYNGSVYFFDHLKSRNVEFDIIGLSYYPFWNGSLDSYKNNVFKLETRYSKKIMVAETAYPFSLSWNDNSNNFVGTENQLLPGYPATPSGQKKFLDTLISITKSIPNGNGIGVCYWEPIYIASSALGSPWENLTLFDFSNNLLPAISAFENKTVSVNDKINFPTELVIYPNYPNPFNPSTVIRFSIPANSDTKIDIFDLTGRNISTLHNGTLSKGTYEFSFSPKNLPSGIYFVKILSGNFYGSQKLILMK